MCDGDDGPSVTLSPAGRIVDQEWLASATIREEVRLDRYVIMPNHFHGIVMIEPSCRSLIPATTGVRPSRPPGALGSLIAGFKSAVTRRVREAQLLDGPVWQRGYHDRVIRNEIDWAAYRNYIADNPKRWLEKHR